MAKHQGLLSDERAAWAEEIYTAGNLAIHGYQKFEKRHVALWRVGRSW
jgi:hypothetical protein